MDDDYVEEELPPPPPRRRDLWNSSPQRKVEYFKPQRMAPSSSAPALTRTQLSKLAKAMFKQCGNATCESAVRAAEDEGFEALRALAAQQQRQLCSSCASTHGIIVRCTSVFVPQQRQQHGKDSYLFSYRITIHNTASNPCTVKLLGRQWEILDGDGNVCGQVPRGRKTKSSGQYGYGSTSLRSS